MTARLPDGVRIKTSKPWLKEEGKRSKYGNRKVGEYDSQKEADYAFQLELLKHADEPRLRVVEFKHHVPFELIPAQEGERAVHYIADFVVQYADGHTEVVDVKGYKTADYIIKRKLMMFVHHIKVREV